MLKVQNRFRGVDDNQTVLLLLYPIELCLTELVDLFVTLGGLPLVDEGFSQARWTHDMNS